MYTDRVPRTVRARTALIQTLLVVVTCWSVYQTAQAQPGTVDKRIQSPVSLQYITTVDEGEFDHYRIVIQVRHLDAESCSFLLPRWAPGAYRLTNWHGGISGVEARDMVGSPLEIEQLDESEWKVSNGDARNFLFSYLVAAPVSVRDGMPQLNNRHYLHELGGLIDGPRSWMYLDGQTSDRIMMHFELPDDWVVASGLNPTPDPDVFWAEDYDWLIDCPTLVGSESNIHRWQFISWGIPFTVAYDAAGQEIEFDHEGFVASIEKICDFQASIFGGFPFEHFTFIYDNGGGGGLEHLRSTTIGGDASRLEEDPHSLWNITAHEFFHVWNVKRIRPKTLGPFDYQRPNRTESLWISEGITETYTAFTGVRAGFITPQEYYDTFARSIAGWMGDPNQPYAAPARTSWTTWDRGERWISYYTQGEVLGMALDLIIREATDNSRSLDDVIRILMWEFGGENLEQPGFGVEDFIYICEDVAGIDLYEFFEDHVTGTEKPDWARYLGYAGLSYTEESTDVVDMGFFCGNTPEGPVVRLASRGRAPAGAGLMRDDRILSVGGKDVSSARDVYDAVSGVGKGGRVRIVVDRGGEQHNLSWQVETRSVLNVMIGEFADATARQELIRRGFITGEVER